MELYQLEYFLETAKQRNFTRAARHLNLAQAALSEQIRNLEKHLGAPLFHRGRRESVLTAAGETLRWHAESLLEGAQAAKTAIQELVGLRGGRLGIGAIPSVSACVLPAAIAIFRKKHPLVELALFEGTSEMVSQWVEQGKVEFGLVQLPTSGTTFEEEILLRESFVLLAPKGHFIAKMKTVPLASLTDEPFILYKGRARDTALIACRAAGFEPRIACESSELETIRSLVAAGLGIALLPKLATRLKASGCHALPISGPPIEREVAILRRSGHTHSSGASVFLEILRSLNHCNG